MTWIKSHLTLIGIAILAAVCLWIGYAARARHVQHQVTAGMAQAAKDDQTGAKGYAKGAADGTKAKDQQDQVVKDTAPLKGDDAAVDHDWAPVAKFHSRPVQPAPGAKPVPGLVADAAPSLAEVAPDRKLIDDLARDLADTKTVLASTQALLATKTDEAAAFQQSADSYRQEAAGLRVVVGALQSTVRPWAAGITYGSNGTLGPAAERDLGPFRVAVALVRRPIGNGNTTIEAQGTALWRF